MVEVIPLPILAAGIAAILAFGGGWKLRDMQADADALKQLQAQRELEDQEYAKQQRNAAISSQELGRLVSERDSLNDTARRLRNRYASLAASASAPAGSSPATSAGDLCPVMLGAAEERLRGLAIEADARRAAGLACERSAP